MASSPVRAGFFKRTVQNNKTYVCVENQQCKIDTDKRKRCPFCRFQKCLNVGMQLEAVRADRMRGGRNKFGPMYKHDRALKQQKKALIQARRLRIESNQKEVTFTSNIHSIAILHNTTLNPSQLPSLSLSQPCNSLAVTQHQITYPSDWAMRLENCSNSADLAAFAEAIVGLHHTSSRSISTQSPRIPQLETEFLHYDPHELQLQKKVFTCLQQEQACRHREPNTFSSVCVMADQLLCSIVEWARTSIFFKELKVSDQMRLLHSCWSELLVLEIISRQVLYGIDGGLLLITGQQGELSLSHAGPALVSLNQRGTELVEKLQMLKVDHQEFACIRFLILFAPDVKELEEHHFVESVQQQVEGALLKYTLASSSQSCNRFTCLQLYLSELRSLSILAEDYLYYKHLNGEVPCNNLLNEMLHAKCCWT
ncbi:nuclear receptor subfamily 5 group A member 2-like isoform X3 [Gambusia affinis]|uniref:nuclear receptor subfamily 5 group A member 2-like isoform X3 n=1 Tax=Gambusia affinis TaxID=33528 RepID=UPI001CDC5A36|nr:nuclear receptor subfamily 5 group A member 2-like isoform X3 [Gambusia affinis]XP_043951918.1 nuclear receptor subfamily 5 group A member 2-like isoform X3 [Gambusia affinis]